MHLSHFKPVLFRFVYDTVIGNLQHDSAASTNPKYCGKRRQNQDYVSVAISRGLRLVVDWLLRDINVVGVPKVSPEVNRVVADPRLSNTEARNSKVLA